MEEQVYNRVLDNERHKQINSKLAEHDDAIKNHEKDIKDLQIVSSARTSEFQGIEKSVNALSKRIEKILEQNRNMMFSIIVLLLGVLVYIYEKGL